MCSPYCPLWKQKVNCWANCLGKVRLLTGPTVASLACLQVPQWLHWLQVPQWLHCTGVHIQIQIQIQIAGQIVWARCASTGPTVASLAYRSHSGFTGVHRLVRSAWLGKHCSCRHSNQCNLLYKYKYKHKHKTINQLKTIKLNIEINTNTNTFLQGV